MKIGALAHATQTQAEAIRYYEREGLLPAAARTGANYRVYDASHIQRLAFIRLCRSLDMTLVEIRILLRFKDAPSANCIEVDSLLDELIGHVAGRIRELKALEKELRLLRLQCDSTHSTDDCGILSELERTALEQSRRPPARGKLAHIRGAH